MLAFLGSEWSVLVNVDAIKTIGIERKRDGGARGVHKERTVYFKDGTDRTVSSYDVEALLKTVSQVIPAIAGTQLLYVGVRGEGEPFINRSNLVAFGFCMDGLLRPITVAGVDDALSEPDCGWFVQIPGGPIENMGDNGTYDDEAKLLDYARRWKAGDL